MYMSLSLSPLSPSLFPSPPSPLTFPPSLTQALVDICHKVLDAVHHKGPGSSRAAAAVKPGSTVTMDEGRATDKEKPFDSMNSIVANLLLNMTRYELRSSYRLLPTFNGNLPLAATPEIETPIKLDRVRLTSPIGSQATYSWLPSNLRTIVIEHILLIIRTYLHMHVHVCTCNIV